MSIDVSGLPIEIDLERVQRSVTNHAMEAMDELVPVDTSTLRQSAEVVGDDTVEYTADYAAYVYDMRGEPRTPGTYAQWDEELDMDEMREFVARAIEEEMGR